MARPPRDYKGLRFGRLLVLRYQEGGKLWCQCDCGTKLFVLRSNAVRGQSQSCGCLQRELSSRRATVHGACKGGKQTRSWHAWSNMMRRCYDAKSISYPLYGARGIEVCRRWQQAALFMLDMGEPPLGKSLGRIDNNGNYTPKNCRWETAKQQGNNIRANVVLIHAGHSMTLTQWAEVLGVPRQRLYKRLQYGWAPERVLTEVKIVGRRPKG